MQPIVIAPSALVKANKINLIFNDLGCAGPRTGYLTPSCACIMIGGMINSAKGRIVLTTGSREFTKQQLVEAELQQLPTPTLVMHGGARGADRLVSECIHTIEGLTEIRVPYLGVAGKRGGFLRNSEMLKILMVFRDQGYDCWALAFHDDIRNPSPGTSGMVKLLNGADFTVVHIDGRSGSGF
jgi:hypothetical protein